MREIEIVWKFPFDHTHWERKEVSSRGKRNILVKIKTEKHEFAFGYFLLKSPGALHSALSRCIGQEGRGYLSAWKWPSLVGAKSLQDTTESQRWGWNGSCGQVMKRLFRHSRKFWHFFASDHWEVSTFKSSTWMLVFWEQRLHLCCSQLLRRTWYMLGSYCYEVFFKSIKVSVDIPWSQG